MTKKLLSLAARAALWFSAKTLALALSQVSPPVREALAEGAAVAERHWLPGFKARTAATPAKMDDRAATVAGRLLRVLQGAR